jgi:hypothetical protein
MRRTILLLAALTAFAGMASAFPMCLNNTATFYQTTYTSAASACQVGDKLFYGFIYSGTAIGGATPVDGSLVNIVGDPTDPNEPGLVFSSTAWTVSSAGGTHGTIDLDSSFQFTVQTVDGRPLIDDASLNFAGHFTVTGVAGADIAETVRPGGIPPGISMHVDSTGPFLTSVLFTNAVSLVTVSKDLVVIIPPNQAGSASISSFREGFSENTPEPVSAFLIGAGLLGFGLLRRRIRA